MEGEETLSPVTLSVRFRMKGAGMSLFMPGILYYGNKNGAKVNPDIIPVYTGKAGEFAIFEDHRYPMPFVMLEEPKGSYAAALHFTPSPVRGAVLATNGGRPAWKRGGLHRFRPLHAPSVTIISRAWPRHCNGLP